MKFLATPHLKDLVENPPPTVFTPALEFLASLQPPGIWRAPLSDKQIAAAAEFSNKGLGAAENPYVAFFPDERVLVQFHSPFARIASCITNNLNAGKAIIADELNDVNRILSEMPADLMYMEIISVHQMVSVVHILSDYSTESMSNTVQKKHGNTYNTTFTFPMPQGDSPGLQLFEFYVPPKLLPPRKQYQVGFTLDFRVLH